MNHNGEFQSTHWSVVSVAAQRGGPESEKALARLIECYWHPLYSFVRRTGHGPEEAEDFTQGFFLSFLEKHSIGRADRERGRFRSFLLGCLKNYLSNERSRAAAQKRGGGTAVLSFDHDEAERRYLLEPADSLTPDLLYDRKWARAMLDRVLAQLERECNEGGRADRFDALKDFITGEPASASYADVAFRLGVSEGTVKSSVHRLRLRYVELFRSEITKTVASPQEVDDEIRHLCNVLAAVG